jgi:hypothetical protein
MKRSELKQIIRKIIKEEMEWPYFKLSKKDDELYDEDGIKLDVSHSPFKTIENAEKFLEKFDIRGTIVGWLEENIESADKKRLIVEDRLSDLDAEYKVEKNKVIAHLKGQKASVFTKFIQRFTELDKTIDNITSEKRELEKQRDIKVSEKGDISKKINEAIFEIFNADEQVMTLVVDCLGSTLTLAKQSDPTKKETIDYVQAWKMVYDLFSNPKYGLQVQLDDILKACTIVEENIRKRSLSVKVKEEGILIESSIIDKIMRFVKYFKKWVKFFKNKKEKVDKIIQKIVSKEKNEE